MPTLVIANRLYSSWSLRPWLMLKAAGVAFDEVLIPLDTPETRAAILAHSPAGKVPVLKDGPVTVWESLAIIEYAADVLAPGRVWPADPAARALARAVSAEMHAGFPALRSACPMNLGKAYAERDRGEAVARDAARAA
jgi:glutathione S-transferase